MCSPYSDSLLLRERNHVWSSQANGRHSGLRVSLRLELFPAAGCGLLRDRLDLLRLGLGLLPLGNDGGWSPDDQCGSRENLARTCEKGSSSTASRS